MGRQPILQDYGNIQNPPGDNSYQIEALHNMQRDKEFNAQLKQRNKEKSDADKYRNLNMIDDATDPSKYQSSTQKANSLATEQLLGIRNEFASKSNIPADQLYMELQRKLTPVAQGYNSYKNDLSEQEEMAKEVVKVNPNLNLEKVLAGLQQQADKHHLITNPDGSINFNQATIGTSSNALTEILKPENAWKYSKGIKPVIDYVKTQGKEAELFAQSSDGSQINYKAKIPDWATLVDQKGNPIAVDPKTGLIPRGVQPILALKGTKQDYQDVDENGRPVMKTMTVVSQDTMNKILSNDELQYAFEGDWQKHKQMPGVDVDPAHEQDLKRVYFSRWLADNGLNQPYVASRTHLPPQPRTTIKVNTGNPVPVMDIVTPVNNYFETHKDAVIRYDSKDGKVKTISGVAPLNVFNNAVTDPIVETIKSRHSGEGLTANNIYYRNIDGTTWVMIARTPDDKKDGQFKINPEEDTPAFKLDEFTNVVGNKPGGIKPKNQALIDAQKKTKTEPIKTVKVKGL